MIGLLRSLEIILEWMERINLHLMFLLRSEIVISI